MSPFRALVLVTAREIRERARSKVFIGSTLFSTVILAAAIILPTVLSSGGDTYHVGSLGTGNDAILAVAKTLATDQAGPDANVTFDVTSFPSRADAEQALRAGDVEVVLVDGTSLLRASSGGLRGSGTDQLLQRAAATIALETELQGTGVGVASVAAIFTQTPLDTTTLDGVDVATTQARSIVAYGGLMLMYFAVLSFGSWTLTGVAEEKSSRVVEVLLATLRPWQLLTGKILGIGTLGIVQFLVAITVALVSIQVTGALSLPSIPLDSAVTLVIWFVLGYGIFSVAFGTAGALVSRMEDAQTAAFPISIVAVAGFFVSFLTLENPGGTVATITTYIPVTAPFVVPIRVAMQQISLLEEAIAVAIALAAIVGLVRFAGRVYAGGLLAFGSKMSFRQAYRAAEIE